MVDVAVSIDWFGHTVSMQALTNNGKNLLSHLNQNMRGEVKGEFVGETLTLEFTQPCDTLDEDSRLREASSFDALRLVQHSFDISEQDKHAIFLGGLFAYELEANSEPPGNGDATNQCPDYELQVTQKLHVVDHETEYCQLQTT